MRRALPVIIALVAGLVLGALFSPLRYHYITAGSGMAIYRCDRITGRVDIGTVNASIPWQTIPKRLEDLSDKELLELRKKP